MPFFTLDLGMNTPIWTKKESGSLSSRNFISSVCLSYTLGGVWFEECAWPWRALYNPGFQWPLGWLHFPRPGSGINPFGNSATSIFDGWLINWFMYTYIYIYCFPFLSFFAHLSINLFCSVMSRHVIDIMLSNVVSFHVIDVCYVNLFFIQSLIWFIHLLNL